MKNKIFNIIISFFIFTIFFIFTNKVNAETIDVNHYDDTYAVGWHLIMGNYQSSLQLFKPYSPYIKKVYFKTTDYFTSKTPNSSCQNQTALLVKCLSSDCFTRETVATSTFTLEPETIIDFGTNISVVQNELYAIFIAYNDIEVVCNISPNIFLNYDCDQYYQYEEDSCYNNTSYFKSYSTVQGSYFFPNTLFKTTYDENNINIDFTPYTSSGGMDENGIYKDFDFWQLDGNNSGTTTQLTLQLQYQKFGSEYSYTDFMSFNQFVSDYPMRLALPKTEPLFDGFYTATATIVAFYDNSIDYLDYDVIHFYINNASGTDTFPFDEMEFFSDDVYSHLCDNVATSSGSYFDDFRYGIECGFRKTIYYIFYPSDTSINNIQIAYSKIKKEFPFSAYFGLTDTINNSLNNSTTTDEGTFKIPFISATGTFYMLPVLSSSSMPNLIGENNTQLFRNSLTWIIWLCVAFLIFITFKKI